MKKNNKVAKKVTTKKKRTLSEEKSFKKYLEKIEDPKYDGADASWALPENATPLEKAKYELCEKILVHQLDNNLTDEEIAEKIKLTTGEAREILYCHIDYFTLDRLISYATRLFKPLEIKMVVELKRLEETPMPEQFKLIKKDFSKVDNEWRWTYSCLFTFTFNKYLIAEITVTNHYQQKPGRKKITNELILNILKERLNNKIAKPSKYQGKRKVFIRHRIPYDGKKYRLIFWFKDYTTNHLWIRNCHPQD